MISKQFTNHPALHAPNDGSEKQRLRGGLVAGQREESQPGGAPPNLSVCCPGMDDALTGSGPCLVPGRKAG